MRTDCLRQYRHAGAVAPGSKTRDHQKSRELQSALEGSQDSEDLGKRAPESTERTDKSP